jgi:hypothetical protein
MPALPFSAIPFSLYVIIVDFHCRANSRSTGSIS